MNRLGLIAAGVILLSIHGAPAAAAGLTEAELMTAATELGHQYDAHYAAHDPDGMISVYASDGVLISPAGPIVRGREDLRAYYVKRFASGARAHAIKVLEVHVQGEGGYGINQFSVTVPGPNGSFHDEHGTIFAVYRHDPDGWHMALVGTSVPPKAD
jgi:ketosteroid isomerase-like protein